MKYFKYTEPLQENSIITIKLPKINKIKSIVTLLSNRKFYIANINKDVVVYPYEILGLFGIKNIDSFSEKVLGYKTTGGFPEVNSIKDLEILINAIENHYDKNHRPIK